MKHNVKLWVAVSVATVFSCAGGESASGAIGPQGGSVTLSSGLTLEVPAGALDDRTQVTVREVRRANGEREIELEPRGTELRASGRLSVPDDGVELEAREVEHGLELTGHHGNGRHEFEIARLGVVRLSRRGDHADGGDDRGGRWADDADAGDDRGGHGADDADAGVDDHGGLVGGHGADDADAGFDDRGGLDGGHGADDADAGFDDRGGLDGGHGADDLDAGSAVGTGDACVTDDTCPCGSECGLNGQCTAVVTCASDLTCAPGEHCREATRHGAACGATVCHL